MPRLQENIIFHTKQRSLNVKVVSSPTNKKILENCQLVKIEAHNYKKLCNSYTKEKYK